ncbi:hypothetical protein AZA_01613 [Nitrospirillum viridazoti Y2]|nr:hypothetical protein AZA_01613 [Nitrospirillum amazonense Y2]
MLTAAGAPDDAWTSRSAATRRSPQETWLSAIHLSPSHRNGCFSPGVPVPDPANRAFRSATASTADQGSSFNLFSTDMAQPQARIDRSIKFNSIDQVFNTPPSTATGTPSP